MKLIDAFGRQVSKLRISVTDRCNLSCHYCMPSSPAWIPRPKVLRFEEIQRLVRITAAMGVTHYRLTGGEPTIRQRLPELVQMLCRTPGVDEVALTTNALLLDRLALPLWQAGLRRLNISLDTLDPDSFARITGRNAFDQAWSGILAAEATGFAPLKTNTVVMRGINCEELPALADLARQRGWHVRFIEFMPLDGKGQWRRQQMVPMSEILERINAAWPLEPVDAPPTSPAREFQFVDGPGRIGVIGSVTQSFCGSCDRIRLTADGQLRTCLFSDAQLDLRGPLRDGASDDQLVRLIQHAVADKPAGHKMDQAQFVRPTTSMFAIGG